MLVQDAKLPSLVAAVAGSPIAGSWWGHPAGREIFRILNEVADHPDVALAKLVNKKQTLVHRDLFAPLCAVGSAREPWQLEGLPRSALDLLAEVDRGGPVRSSGDDAKRLELTLLVASQDVHTDSGAHAKELVSWTNFARQRKVPARRPSAAAAKAALDEQARALGARVKLPWPP